MYLTQSPETVMLIHRSMVEAEMARNRHRNTHLDNQGRPNRPIGGLRIMIGGSLIALGARLAPPASAVKSTSPAGQA